MKINCPSYVNTAFKLLEKSGFKAYAVGGCIRDILMNKAPNDWDMTTSSTPEETMEVFKEFRTIPTGIKHGTVTVIIEGIPIEITTMRIDGEYIDSRRPENVKFTADITEDLSRRDFTVNAIAYNHLDGLIDPFNGQRDIELKTIRCVGDPNKRFTEDALRIIRALRFASVLEFNIDTETAKSALINSSLLNNIANERIRVELIKLLTGNGVEKILTEFKDIIFTIIPELKPLDGFEQKTPFHIYDIWTHTVKVVSGVKNTRELRMAALLHDIGKPNKFYLDENNVAHFKGHPELSAKMAAEILKHLRFSNTDISLITQIIFLHDTRPNGSKKRIAKLCSSYSAEILKLTLQLMRGDAAGKNPYFYEHDIQTYELAEKQIEEIEAQKLCLKLSDLDINGKDIAALGYNGKEIGDVLNYLLEQVIEERIANNYADLTNTAKMFKNK